jgi:peptide deformylase
VVVEFDNRVYKLVNPQITKKKGKILFNEGCLSFPDMELSVPRAQELWLRYTDEQSRQLEAKVEGVLAVIIQHEIDHINGVLFIDKVSFLKRVAIAKKLKKIKKLYKQSQAKKP